MNGLYSFYVEQVAQGTAPDFKCEIKDAAGVLLESRRFTLMMPNVAIPNKVKVGTSLQLTQVLPLNRIGAVVHIGGARATIDEQTANATGTVLWLDDAAFSFPAMLYGQDARDWGPGSYPGSPVAITASRAGGLPFQMIDWYFRNVPIRVEQLGGAYNAPLPWTIIHDLQDVEDRRTTYHDLLSDLAREHVYSEKRVWVCHLVTLPEPYFTNKLQTAERDADPTPPLVSGPGYSNTFLGVSGNADPFSLSLDGTIAYCQVGLYDEVVRELHAVAYAGMPYDAPYTNLGYGGSISRFDMLRARVLAHESFHHLVGKVGTLEDGTGPPRTEAAAIYPEQLREEFFHLIPGIARPAQDEVVDPVVGGAAMQSGAQLDVSGGQQEADLAPYMVWRCRKVCIAPRIFRSEE